MTSQDEKPSKEATQAVTLAFLRTEGIIQKYIAYLLEMDESKLWPDGLTAMMSTRMKRGDKEYALELKMCDAKYQFDAGELDSTVLRQQMADIINAARVVYAHTLNSLGSTLGDKLDFLRNSRLVVDPSNTTMVVYTPVAEHTFRVRDLPKRIGFSIG